ncbi:HD domain-containing protein [Stutzerimonas sp. KH-1]|jgi:hypothetical protein
MKLVSLEKEFAKACSKHPNLKLLESQWRFDKELISKALQNISAIFPHYSRHDASHSKQIIVNIERLLGNRIKHLTATDMWLILEAAYNHDIGMVITHKQIQDLDTPEFSAFIKEIALHSEHSLNLFAIDWLESKANLPIGSNSHAFLNKYIQLIAEWYRKKHPENSAKIIRNPYAEIGLDSPRNELLPSRLFDCLASICNAHGESFEETLRLPFAEAGMATEDCHPRYIAFLLRLGDLLDIDDNRFCPVMMRMSGAQLPVESHAHYEKHRSIKHFRLDPDRIEIEVVCPTPSSYEQAYQWFKWLEEEHHKLSQNWNIIVPHKKLGPLATLSAPQVLIEKPFLTIENGKRPRFKVNEDATLKLLRSVGLYSKKSESIREILQNAVDSTLLAIWIKHKETIKILNPAKEELHAIYQKYPIETKLTQDIEEPDVFWLTVKDAGTGISENDLRYMLEAGSSPKNKWKSGLIQDMPVWYRPSGNFGIGLQSIYLLSDHFSITTKSIHTNEALEVTFSSSDNKSVVIKRIAPESTDFGASIKIKIRMSGFPETIRFPDGVYASAQMEKLLEYDFTREGSNLRGYEELSILAAIYEFSEGSPIKISAKGALIDTCRENPFFSDRENLLLYNLKFGQNRSHIDTLFRGQRFNDLTSRNELISGTVDFYGYQAIDFLSYNREKILTSAKRPATESLEMAVIEYIEDRFDSLPDSEQAFAAAYHFLHCTEQEVKYPAALMDFPVLIDGGTTRRLGEVLDDIKNQTIEEIDKRDINSNIPTPQNTKTLILNQRANSSTPRLIKLLATKDGMFWQESHGYTSSYKKSIWSKDDIQPVSNEILASILTGSKFSFEVGSRSLFPSWGKYRDLEIEIEAGIPWARLYWKDDFNNNHLVLPCLFRLDNNALIEADDTLINWAYARRKNKNIQIEKYKNLYSELAEHLRKIQNGNA